MKFATVGFHTTRVPLELLFLTGRVSNGVDKTKSTF